MIKFCTQCIHYRLRPPLRIVQSGSGSSPGRINAATEEMRVERERRDTEQRRIDEQYRFDYEPSFFPWCARFTPSDEDLADLREKLIEGQQSDEVIRAAQAAGRDFFIDASRGVVGRIFALCRRRNANGDCDQYKAA
jgi:hypothetical protein